MHTKTILTRHLTLIGCLALIICLVALPTCTTAKEAQDIALLKSDARSADKALACKRLAVYGTGNAVESLDGLLSDPQLSSWARIALEAIDDPAADSALRAAAAQLEGRLLIGVINSIARRRDATAVPLLIKKLDDDNPEVASAAAVALGRISGDTAINALLPRLTRGAEPLRNAVAEGCILAAEAMLEKGHHAHAMDLYDTVRAAPVNKQRRIEATRGAILTRQGAGVDLLAEQLRSKDKDLFDLGLHTARELTVDGVSEVLMTEMERAVPQRKPYLLLALADRKDKAALSAAMKGATHGDLALRIQAVQVLGRLSDPIATEILLNAALAPDAVLAKKAWTALIRMPAPEVDEAVIAMLTHHSEQSRILAVDLVAERKPANTVPLLMKATGDHDEDVRITAINSLRNLAGKEQLSSLLEILLTRQSSIEMRAAEGTVTAISLRVVKQDPACLDQVLKALHRASGRPKSALLRILNKLGGDQALQAVRTTCRDTDATVRETALRVLCDWPDTSALGDLLGLSQNAENRTFRILALRGYIRLVGLDTKSPAQKLAAIREVLPLIERKEEKQLLLANLARIRTVESLEIVTPYLTDPILKEEACAAVLAIAGSRSPYLKEAVDALAVVTRVSSNTRTVNRARDAMKKIKSP